MRPAGYSRLQIWLHWTVAALIALQVAFHEGIETVRAAARGGPAATESDAFMADMHVAVGISVFALALIRLGLRLRRGAPAVPEAEWPPLRLLARLTHFLLYTLILAMPLSGAAAWFGGVEAAARAHGIMMVALAALVALHFAGALYQHFFLRTNVLRRMLRSGDPGVR